MPGEAAHRAKRTPLLRTLADRVNWLISTAHPADRGPYTNAQVAALIQKITGEPVSYTTIWKLRNGQATNPQKRLIEAIARTFGVRPAFFFGDHDENQAGLIQKEAEMLPRVSTTPGRACGKYSRVPALVSLHRCRLDDGGAGSGRAGCCVVEVAMGLNGSWRLAAVVGTVAVAPLARRTAGVELADK